MAKITAYLLKGKDAQLQGRMFERTMTAWLPKSRLLIRYIRQLSLREAAFFFARTIFSRNERWQMMIQSGNAKRVVADAMELPPLNVLLHCRTVVESTDSLSTGVMTHVEGELFEVELHDFDKYELGENVKLTVYSPAGLQTIQSIVFAKYEGAIALIQPPNVQKRFKERREHPRVNVNGNIQVYSVQDETGEERKFDHPLTFAVQDISLSGIGISAPDTAQIYRNMKLKANVELEFGFNCELEVIRRERQDDKLLIGAKMQVIEQEMMRPLRAMILKQQVEKSAELRKETTRKQRF